jgi:hypothetical protein
VRATAHRVAKDDLPAARSLDRRPASLEMERGSRQVICGYAFASSSHARAVKDATLDWNV